MEPDRFDYIETPAGVDPVDADDALLEKTGLDAIGFDAVDEDERKTRRGAVVVEAAPARRSTSPCATATTTRCARTCARSARCRC